MPHVSPLLAGVVSVPCRDRISLVGKALARWRRMGRDSGREELCFRVTQNRKHQACQVFRSGRRGRCHCRCLFAGQAGWKRTVHDHSISAHTGTVSDKKMKTTSLLPKKTESSPGTDRAGPEWRSWRRPHSDIVEYRELRYLAGHVQGGLERGLLLDDIVECLDGIGILVAGQDGLEVDLHRLLVMHG